MNYKSVLIGRTHCICQILKFCKYVNIKSDMMITKDK